MPGARGSSDSINKSNIKNAKPILSEVEGCKIKEVVVATRQFRYFDI
jgi:hypothetical protein